MSNLIPTSNSDLAIFDLTPDTNSPAAAMFALVQEGNQSSGDKIYSTFPRLTKLASNTTINWKTPGSDFDELDKPAHALKGVIVMTRYGLSLYDSEQNKGMCRTTKIEPNNLPSHVDPLPMPSPMYSPQAYDSNPPEPSPELTRWNPYGSRGFSCVECVNTNRHVNTYVDKNGVPHTDTCGLNTMVLMCVYQIGYKKTIPSKGVELIEWVNTQDIVDAEGNHPYADEPLFVNLSISRMPVMKSIGPKLSIKNASKGGYIPDNAQTLNTFMRESYTKGNVYPSGNLLVNNMVVDMFLGTPVGDNKPPETIKSIPVFCVDTSLQEDTTSLVRLAYSNYLAKMKDNAPTKSVVEPSIRGAATLSATATEVTVEEDDDGFESI